MNKTKADARDDVVYSNLAYIAPALVAPDPVTQAVLAVTGAALCAGSAVYHATYTRAGQSLDVSTMLTYVASLACAVAAQWTPWAWAALPVAATGYWMYPWRVNSYLHVPAWTLATLIMLAAQAGAWSLLPGGLFVAGGAIKIRQPGADSVLHSWWHILGGAAGAAAMWVL
jgi:hypothetical protein